ncbi:MAG TPA: hypothetical protein VF506_21480 [Streptosporangiaceae bacterium]
MKQELDELVRDSMTSFTDGIELPGRLIADARPPHHRRRARIGWLTSGAAVTVAAAVAIGTALSGATPQHRIHHRGNSGGPIQTTAMVITRMEHALTAAAAGNPVAYTREVDHGVKLFLVTPHGQPIQVSGNVTRTWSRGPLQHVIVGTPTGKPALSTLTDNSGGKSVQTTVSYQQRAWWRGTYAPTVTTRPKVGCRLGEMSRTPAQWAREVRKLLSCGAAVAGRQRMDGVAAIKLKLSSSYRRACAGSNSGSCHPVSVAWSGILWANAKTYLPVRLISHGHHYSFLIDFRWLAPTAANLAKLHQSIPAGFKHV